MAAADPSVLRIGAVRVDPALDEICANGTIVKLEPRTMRLLVCLAAHAGQVVSVEQLLREVWNDIVVNADSVYQGITALRRALGDDPKHPTFIANVPRRGYRLVAPVSSWVEPAHAPLPEPTGVATSAPTATSAATQTRSPIWTPWVWGALGVVLGAVLLYLAVDWLWLSRGAAQEPARVARAPLDERSIAVLAFADMSDTKDQEYFSDGLSEELLNLLGKVPELHVAARTSAFSFKGKSD